MAAARKSKAAKKKAIGRKAVPKKKAAARKAAPARSAAARGSKQVLGNPRPGWPYSPGWRAGDFVYTAGQLGWDDNNQLAGPTIEEQTRAALRRVLGVQDHQAGIVDPAVRVRESGSKQGLERGAGRVATEVDLARARQPLAAAQVIVEEQAEADDPSWTLLRAVRQDEP